MGSQRLILHIGANKTGSSAVQSFLRLNANGLKHLNYLIPDKDLEISGRIGGEHVFAFQRLFDEGAPAAVEAKLSALLAGANGANVLVSAENLSNHSNFKFFGSFLKGLDCKVVLYVRRQDELLTSSWQQWYSKHQSDLGAWIFSAVQKLGHWRHCIEGWEAAVGQGNVIVRVFQKADLKNGDVVDDLMAVLGLGDATTHFERPVGLVNPSYSDLITPLVSKNPFLFKNDHDNEFYHFVQKMTGDYYVTQKKVSLLTRAQRDSIIAYYKDENQFVARKYFAGRQELFEKVEHSKYDYLDGEELVRRQLGFVTSLLFAMWKQTNPK